MKFEDIHSVPKDGATYLLHVSKAGVVMFRIDENGRSYDMTFGKVSDCMGRVIRHSFPEAEIHLNNVDRVGSRTNYAFASWKEFCFSYNAEEATKKHVIAEYVWVCTKRADGLVEEFWDDVSHKRMLRPTERGLKADETEAAPEEDEDEDKEVQPPSA